MKQLKKNTLLTIVGPTAIGKTAKSIAIANQYKANIISCDSRQFFKEMSIGTAVPELHELATVPHHFIQNISIFDSYSVGQFEKDALAKLEELFVKNPIQLMVGGSGLYVNAVLNGLDHFPKVDASIRKKITNDLHEQGIESLQNRLKKLDPVSYETIAINNPHRIIRALEICIGTKKTYSSFKNKPKITRNFTAVKIGFTADRTIIYDRINKRVDLMMANGLLEEAKKLHPHKELNALQTVGYKELFAYFDGEISLDFAISEIKKNTRRFAKRQLTWFRKDAEILWFDYKTDTATICKVIDDKIRAF